MGDIYKSSMAIFNELKVQYKNNLQFLFLSLLLISVPFSHTINNLFLILFILATLNNHRGQEVKLSSSLLWPILLFILMCLSLFWSINYAKTLNSIPREITLIIIPLAFILTSFVSYDKRKVLIKHYSYCMAIYAIVCLLRALVRFLIMNDPEVFFYHELVTKDVNAIHVSVYIAISFFYFFEKEKKEILDLIIALMLFCFIILLSSKNIILVFIILTLIQLFFYSKLANKLRLRNLFILLSLLILLLSIGKIKNRFIDEFNSNSRNSLSHNVELNKDEGIRNVSIAEAWKTEKFMRTDYFPGTAFRIYQFRMFIELFRQDNVFLTGYGLNASQGKLLEKEKKYNLYQGYGSYNFHNQYIQNFAELGVFGFLLLVAMLLINLKNAIKSKDFVHFAFAILMISLFLTESFLWRQRGVVFFTILYCLFNSKNLIKANNTNN